MKGLFKPRKPLMKGAEIRGAFSLLSSDPNQALQLLLASAVVVSDRMMLDAKAADLAALRRGVENVQDLEMRLVIDMTAARITYEARAPGGAWALLSAVSPKDAKP